MLKSLLAGIDYSLFPSLVSASTGLGGVLGVSPNELRRRMSRNTYKNSAIFLFVNLFSPMVLLVAILESMTAEGCSRVVVDLVFRH